MEEKRGHPLIQVTQEDMREILKKCNIDSIGRIKEGAEALREWCQKQEHFVEPNINQNLLEQILLLTQGSVEIAKKKVDYYVTVRGLSPDMMLHRPIEEFEKLTNVVNYVSLPKLVPEDRSRVNVAQMRIDNVDDFNLLTYFRYNFMLGEYRKHYDFTNSERFIIDLKNCSLSLIGKLNPVVVKKAESLCTEGFGIKVKGIHILNAPSFVDKLMFILKQSLKDKIAKRVHVHSSYDDLQKHIPMEILPEDYGGHELSVSKLAALWRKELETENARKIINDLDRVVTDERKRDSTKFTEEYMGISGSFRCLSVD